MNALKPPQITWNNKVYSPLPSNAITSTGFESFSATIDVTTNKTAEEMGELIDKAVKRQIKEHEMKAHGMSFNDLEKDLKEFGIQLSTIRSNSGDFGYEIEGYFDPSIYNTYMARKLLTLTPVQPAEPKPIPKKVIFSGPATTIIWKDGTKTTVKCQGEDVWDDDVGIAMCYLKKMLGNKGNFNNIFREAMKVSEVQTKKEELASSTAIEGESYYSSALDSMKRNIDEINDFMKDAADALDKALGGKK